MREPDESANIQAGAAAAGFGILIFAFGIAAGVLLAFSGLGFAEGAISALVTARFPRNAANCSPR